MVGGESKWSYNIFSAEEWVLRLVSGRGQIKKKMGLQWGKGCVCIKDWFKPIFPVCLT